MCLKVQYHHKLASHWACVLSRLSSETDAALHRFRCKFRQQLNLHQQAGHVTGGLKTLQIILRNSLKQKVCNVTKQYIEKSRECPSHNPQPTPDTGNGSFRPLSRSPWVVSPWVVSPPSRFALHYVSRFALLPWVVSPTVWSVVSPTF